MDETLVNQCESEKVPVKWPLVSFRISQAVIDELIDLTGEPSGGKAAKAAVLEYIRMKRSENIVAETDDVAVAIPDMPMPGELPPEPQVQTTIEQVPSSQTGAPVQPQQGEAAYLPKLVETLSVIAQNLQQPQTGGAAQSRGSRRAEIAITPEQEAMRNSNKITEAYFRDYFKRMRAVGQKDATKENEAAFWQYLIAADFNKADGSPITKYGLPSSFVAWARNRTREARELAERKRAEAEAKAAAKEEEAARKEATEAWNDMMLRSEKNVNWDEE